LSSRDLLGSSYTETYSAANGSEVTEQLQEQVWCLASLPWASGIKVARLMTLSRFLRTIASTKAMWKGTRAQLPVLAPVLASGMYCRPRQEAPF
jgi:hypothetical protein